MDKNITGVIAAIVLVVAVFAVKKAFMPVPQDPKIAEEAARKKTTDERAERIAGNSPSTFQLDEPKEDFSITFPNKPTPKDIVLLGGPGGVAGIDRDWETDWLDDTHYTVHRRTAPKKTDDEKAFVKNAAKRKIDHEHGFNAGTPREWIIADPREFMLQDEFPAAEFSYTYKKFSHQEPRAGRVLIVRVPGELYYIQADGPPDYIAGPVTQRFFSTFRYSPKPKPAPGKKR